ncbi:MAG: 5-guanidino-2-oxopentanoate decarboxylase [Synergistales bacterium]|nr:5-guanidino-2-oxopentanoate decarboxylase [Synergistales bacterium]
MVPSKGGELVVRTLEKLGVDVIFGIPGIHNLDIYDSLANSSIRHVGARHEQGSGFMALGYARMSGKPGVALTITGPGLTNIITAMGQAFHDSVPMLVISSQIETSALNYRSGYLHELRNSTILASSVAKESRIIRSHQDISNSIMQAYNLVTSGRPGPVHLEIPLDILGEPSPIVESDFQYPLTSALPCKDEIKRAAKLITSTSSPIIIVGGGSRKASEEVTGLSELLKAPVVQTCAGKGVMDEEHPLCLGSRLHFPSVQQLIEQSDLVIAVGTEFSPTDFWKRSLKIRGSLMVINEDPSSFFNQHSADMGIKGDAGIILRSILDLFQGTEIAKEDSADIVRTVIEESRAMIGQVTGIGKELPGLLRTVAALRENIASKGVLWADMTTLAYLGISEFPVSSPGLFEHPVGFGTLGAALPAAIGSLMAEPEKEVCVLAGDGGFQFTLPELAVAAELQHSLPILIWNDKGYGEIRRNQNSRKSPRNMAVDHRSLDYLSLGKCYGIHAVAISSLDELSEALGEAWKRNSPMLIEMIAEEVIKIVP